LKTLHHPLIVPIRNCDSGANNANQAVVTRFVENGSLADHLPDADNCDFCRLSDSTTIVRIIVGIVLAMCFLHSESVIHLDLTPNNILLNWDWTVRICDFGHSLSIDHPEPILSIHQGATEPWRNLDYRYLAPECYKGVIVPESDVFSFGLILYELIIGRPVFPKCMGSYKIEMILQSDDWQLSIQDDVILSTAKLIRDCLAIDYRERPSFFEILGRLKSNQFKLMTGVNSAEIANFVDTIEAYEFLSHVQPIHNQPEWQIIRDLVC
jgi:serine/threonine protein kinase